MAHFPEYQVRGEIRRIVRRPSGVPEVLLRIRGRSYLPADPRTFVHVKVADRFRRTAARSLRVGAEVTGTIIMTARWLEEVTGPERSLEINRRPKSGRIPRAIRVVGYDSRIVGEVVKVLDEEHFALDAGIPILVRMPGASPGLPPEGGFVEFLLHETPVVEIL